MNIPKAVQDLFNAQALIALGTASQEGIPNVNVVFWKNITGNDRIILLDNFMKTTKENIIKNPNVCITFWDSQTEEGYKIKGKAQYFSEGPVFEEGKNFIQAKNPGRVPRGVIEIIVKEVYVATPGPNAGNKIEG
jgi:predicted pyridoxine 5'-phosphate oxidase superfamily flavin-nucleotide-binding protein